MVVIGITGGLGTGKTTVARIFHDLGAKVLDADKLAHQVIAPKEAGFQKIVRAFGPGVVRRGRIDRRRLASIVFSDPRALRRLERIIHPQVIRHIRDEIAFFKKAAVKCVVADVPLLFESGLAKEMDVVLVVRATQKQQVQRTMRRLAISREDIFKRILRQMPLSQKVQLADIVVDNRGSLQHTREQVEKVWGRIVLRRENKF
jgi:dephospho-CoA kinase